VNPVLNTTLSCIVKNIFFFFVALNLPLGKRSVMHLVARENLPEPPSQGREILIAHKSRFFFMRFFYKIID
jgi:hypothetical protein